MFLLYIFPNLSLGTRFCIKFNLIAPSKAELLIQLRSPEESGEREISLLDNKLDLHRRYSVQLYLAVKRSHLIIRNS